MKVKGLFQVFQGLISAVGLEAVKGLPVAVCLWDGDSTYTHAHANTYMLEPFLHTHGSADLIRNENWWGRHTQTRTHT